MPYLMENKKFLTMFGQSGMKNKAEFIFVQDIDRKVSM